MSDTLDQDRRNTQPDPQQTPDQEDAREIKQPQEASQQPDGDVRPAEETQQAADDGAQAESQDAQEEIEVTAVQFPKIEPEEAPPNAIEDIPFEDEELPSLEDDRPVDKGALYNFVAKMDDRQFRRAQMILGIVLGALAAVALMIPIPGDSSSVGMWGFVIALVLVLWIPRMLERKLEQRLPVTQKWLIIVFLIGMLVTFGLNALNGGLGTTPAASASPSPSATIEATATPNPSATIEATATPNP